MEEDDLNLMLSKNPRWITQWGITVILFFFSLLLAIAFYVKYPDKIESRIKLVSLDSSVLIISKSNGKLSEILCNTNDTVKLDQYLAMYENPASIVDIIKTSNLLKYSTGALRKNALIPLSLFENDLKLGNLQNDYSIFKDNYINYYRKKKYLTLNISNVNLEIENYINLSNNLEQQKNLALKNLELHESKYKLSKKWITSDSLSEKEFGIMQTELLKENILKKIEQNILSVKNQILALSQKRLGIQERNEKDLQNISNSLETSYNNLQKAISIWEQKYIIKASSTGKISIMNSIRKDQNIAVSDTLFNIIPFSNMILGLVNIPVSNSGKVLNGQKVLVKFDSYPFHEFGIVEGIVESISQKGNDNLYSVNIIFPNGLLTSNNINLKFQQKMGGLAEIILQDVSLFNRIFNKVIMIKKN